MRPDDRRYLTAALTCALLLAPAPTVAKKPRTLWVRASAYCSRCDPSRRTATGKRFGTGRFVAVDPDIIPIGSRVYVPGWGWGRAEDTGRAIRGRRIDVRVSRGRCRHWGVRHLRIRVIRKTRRHAR